MSALSDLFEKSELADVDDAFKLTPLEQAILLGNIEETASEAADELAALRAQLAEAVEALEAFAIANPIGVSNQWMPDFERAAAIVAKHQG